MTENTDPSEPDRTESDSNERAFHGDQNTGVSCRDAASRAACDACETTQYAELRDVSLGELEYDVCGDCLQLLVVEIEEYHWWERLTEAHYERAAAFLRSHDAVWCVKDGAYAGGELWVHTPYCDAAVVRDVCDHFGFQIRWFRVVYPFEDGFECVSEHGPCIEINLTFTTRRSDPIPLDYDIQDDVKYHEIGWLEDRHCLFGPSPDYPGFINEPLL